MDWSTLMLAAIIVLAAATISGLTGFGFGLISVPPLLMLFEPASVLTITKILTISSTWIVVIQAWREVRVKILLQLLPFAIIGASLGLQLLRVATADAIKLIASTIVVTFALMLIRGLPQREFRHPLMAPFSGFISGIMSTSTGLSGPPIILYFTLTRLPVQAFRVTIASYFVLLDLFGMPALIRGGFVTRGDLKVALMLVPVAFLGRWGGARLSGRFSREQFYRLTLGILVLTGVIGIVSTLIAFLG